MKFFQWFPAVASTTFLVIGAVSIFRGLPSDFPFIMMMLWWLIYEVRKGNQ